jgi:hypothetical protein
VSTALHLVDQHFAVELERETDRLWGSTSLSYSAYLYENGDVELYVLHSSDNGFCLSSGPLLRKTFKPFSNEQFLKIVERRKFTSTFVGRPNRNVKKSSLFKLKFSRNEHDTEATTRTRHMVALGWSPR